MIQKISTTITLIALIIASIFAVTFSTLPQSWALVLLLPIVVMSLIRLFSSRETSRGGMLIGFMAVGIVYTVIRAYLSTSIDLAIQDMFVLAAFVFGFIIVYKLKSKRAFERRFLQVISGVVIVNLLMYIPSVNEFRDDLLGFAKGEWNTGLFNHRNFFGNFMAMSSCVLVSKFLLTKDQSRSRWIYLIIGLGAAFAVFIAMSRGGAMGLLSGLAVIFVWYILSREKSGSRVPRWLSFGILIGALIIAIAGANWVFEKRDMKIADDSRMNYFSMAVDQISEAPIVGSGSRSVEYKSYSYWHPDLYRNMDFKFTHNEFLQVIADYGIIGFIIMIGVLINYIFLVGGTLYRKILSGESISMQVAGFSCITIMTVNSLVSFPLHAFPNMMMFGIVIGLSLSQRNEAKDRSSMKGKVSSLSRLGLCSSVSLLVAFVTLPVMKEFLASSQFVKQGIFIDDANWVEENNDSPMWLQALEGATKYSPTFTRENQLGYIYLHMFELSRDESYLEKAEARFLIAKGRHPEDPVSRLNIAYIHKLKGDFDLSIKEYKAVMPMVLPREENFNALLGLIEAELGLITNKIEAKEESEAKVLLKGALEKCRVRYKVDGGRTPRFYHAYESVLLNYMRILSYKAGKDEKMLKSSLLNEYIELCKRRSPFRESENLIRSCSNLNKFAREVWVENRDPQGAINILYSVENNLYRIKSAKPDIVSNLAWKKAIGQMEEMRNFLQKAGFKAVID